MNRLLIPKPILIMMLAASITGSYFLLKQLGWIK